MIHATTKYTGLVSDTSEISQNVTIANTSMKLLWSILHIPDIFNVEILIYSAGIMAMYLVFVLSTEESSCGKVMLVYKLE